MACREGRAGGPGLLPPQQEEGAPSAAQVRAEGGGRAQYYPSLLYHVEMEHSLSHYPPLFAIETKGLRMITSCTRRIVGDVLWTLAYTVVVIVSTLASSAAVSMWMLASSAAISLPPGT